MKRAKRGRSKWSKKPKVPMVISVARGIALRPETARLVNDPDAKALICAELRRVNPYMPSKHEEMIGKAIGMLSSSADVLEPAVFAEADALFVAAGMRLVDVERVELAAEGNT